MEVRLAGRQKESGMELAASDVAPEAGGVIRMSTETIAHPGGTSATTSS